MKSLETYFGASNILKLSTNTIKLKSHFFRKSTLLPVKVLFTCFLKDLVFSEASNLRIQSLIIN